MVGFPVAIFAEGPTELGDDGHHGIAPFAAQFLCQCGETPAETVHVVGARPLSGALIDVCIAAADIDEADAVLLAHQPPDPPSLQLESLGREGVAVGILHLHVPMQKVVGDKLRPADRHDPFGVDQAREQMRTALALADTEMASVVARKRLDLFPA